jgi:hypothetical protein
MSDKKTPTPGQYVNEEMINFNLRNSMDAAAKYLQQKECRQGVAASVVFFLEMAKEAETWETNQRYMLSGNVPFSLSAYYRQFADLLRNGGNVTREDIDKVIYGGHWPKKDAEVDEQQV